MRVLFYFFFKFAAPLAKSATPWAKWAQLIVVRSFVKNQRILMQFPLLDFKRTAHVTVRTKPTSPN